MLPPERGPVSRSRRSWGINPVEREPADGTLTVRMKVVSLYGSVVLSFSITLSALAGVPDVWQLRSSPVTNQLNAVAWGNGLFVAVGADMTILTSPDGVGWIQ